MSTDVFSLVPRGEGVETPGLMNDYAGGAGAGLAMMAVWYSAASDGETRDQRKGDGRFASRRQSSGD